MKTIEERKAILDAEIIKQQKKGWQVTSRTNTTCQLIKDKKPETIVVIILILLFVIPGILYLIFMKGAITVYVEITDNGEIKYSGKDLSPYEIEQLKNDYVEIVVEGRKLSPYEIELREKELAKNKRNENPSSTSPDTDKSIIDLGLLTTNKIADGLKIPEEEVINLITTNQLKGKVTNQFL